MKRRNSLSRREIVYLTVTVLLLLFLAGYLWFTNRPASGEKTPPEDEFYDENVDNEGWI